MRRPFVFFGLAAGLYFLLAVALTWPLILHPGSRVPNDLGDSLLNMFLLAWNAHEVPLTADWWNLPQFHPLPGVMAFSEHLLGLTVITTPIMAATGNVILAYNAAFFLSFPLCALAAHALGYELTRRHDAALVAGIAYGFAPYRMAQFAHVQVLSLYWIPLALFALHVYARRPGWRWAALFAVAWVMQALTCGYYLFYFSVLVALWLAWFGVGRIAWRDLARLTVTWAVGVVVMTPFAYGYLKFQSMYGLKRALDEIESFSADIASLLAASGNLRLWGWLKVVDRPESTLFPGLAILLAIAVAVTLAWSNAARSGTRPVRASRIVFAAAAVFALVAAIPAWLGPWRLEIGGLRLLSLSTPQKPLSLALLCAVVALALHPSIRLGWQRRSPLAFYTIAAVWMWLFCLGPSPTFMNEPLLYKAPYAWLMHVPGVDGVRVPARFWTLATMCLATSAALAVPHLTARWRRGAGAIPAVFVVLLLIESWPRPLELMVPPAARPAHARASARLDLPIISGHDLIALYRAVEHRRPVVNGYSGYFAPHYGAMRHLLERHDARVLEHLAASGALEVVIDHDQDPSGEWRRYVSAQPQAELVHQEAGYSAYRIARSLARFDYPPLTGDRLPVASIIASVGREDVGNMLDGDRISRWSTGGPQGPTNQFVVELSSRREVSGVEMQLTGYVADFPRHLFIEVSDDGAAWREVWAGETAFIAYLAALQDPSRVPLRFTFAPAPARFIRFRQTSSDPVYYWTITELTIAGR